ncbi:MAG TPA: flagellar export chaperone FliS [Rhodocyclaceae bacterium]
MFGNYNAVSAYKSVGVDSAVTAADPHKLILLLLDGGLSAISIAKGAMAQGQVAGKGEAISKAIDIVENGLRASLDKEQGGELALQLDLLYEYMGRRLLHANVKNDSAALDEVSALLREIHAAWSEIRKRAIDQAANPAAAA